MQAAGAADFIFVPTLVALLRNRQFKRARGRCSSATASQSSTSLAHFLRDPEEDIWVRRHIPTSLAQIPSQKSVDVLVAALDEQDGFLRFKVSPRSSACDAPMRRSRSRKRGSKRNAARGSALLQLPVAAQQPVRTEDLSTSDLLSTALDQKMERTRDRIYRLLALIYPWRDIGAAQWTLAPRRRAQPRQRIRILDNILTGQLRKRIMPVLEDLPARGTGPARQRAAQDTAARPGRNTAASHQRR